MYFTPPPQKTKNYDKSNIPTYRAMPHEEWLYTSEHCRWPSLAPLGTWLRRPGMYKQSSQQEIALSTYQSTNFLREKKLIRKKWQIREFVLLSKEVSSIDSKWAVFNYIPQECLDWYPSIWLWSVSVALSASNCGLWFEASRGFDLMLSPLCCINNSANGTSEISNKKSRCKTFLHFIKRSPPPTSTHLSTPRSLLMQAIRARI